MAETEENHSTSMCEPDPGTEKQNRSVLHSPSTSNELDLCAQLKAKGYTTNLTDFFQVILHFWLFKFSSKAV
jgi:hypothetical protein